VNRPRILISEAIGFPQDALALLGEVGRVMLFDLDRRVLEADIPNADVLWVRLRHRIDAALMAKAPELRIIVTPTTGLNHIDTEEAARRGIQVISLRGKTDFLKDIRATAEHTLGLMLALLRHLPGAAADVNAGNWRRDLFQGTELHRKTVGLFGYGRLGTIVARYLRAFDARVLVTDPKITPGLLEPGLEAVSPEQLLRESDLISIHVDLHEDTRRFFTAGMFQMMKLKSCFINTSRGELIDETALLVALESGRIAGAALDVLSDESSEGMKGNPLVEYARRHGNLIITPHIGGCTFESMQKTERFLADELHGLICERSRREEFASSRLS
jgi:D-3-phosphoglycerate dehydrogenase